MKERKKERKSEILAAAELWSLLKSGQLKTGQTLTWPSSSAVSSSRVATMRARRGFGPRFFFFFSSLLHNRGSDGGRIV